MKESASIVKKYIQDLRKKFKFNKDNYIGMYIIDTN